MVAAIKPLLLIPALALLLSGCSGLLFYPDAHRYTTPDQFGLEFEEVQMPTPDGELLYAWWLPANTDSAPPKGTVYFLHGNAQNISSHFINVAWLVNQGYNLLALDYRGFGASTGKADLSGALIDVETGLDWVLERHGDDPVFMLGQSIGGALSIPVLARRDTGASMPDALIIDGTISGFRGIAREKLGSFWLTWPLQLPLSWTISGAHEPIDYIDQIELPLMIIHSRSDEVIPFHHGEALYKAASEPRHWLETDTRHTGTFQETANRQSLLRFLERP